MVLIHNSWKYQNWRLIQHYTECNGIHCGNLVKNYKLFCFRHKYLKTIKIAIDLHVQCTRLKLCKVFFNWQLYFAFRIPVQVFGLVSLGQILNTPPFLYHLWYVSKFKLKTSMSKRVFAIYTNCSGLSLVEFLFLWPDMLFIIRELLY